MIANSSHIKTIPKPPRTGYLPTLDGWRAIAIALVMLAHAQWSISAATGGVSDTFYSAFPKIGLFGVQIFFGISGFLICSRLIEEDAVRGRIHLKGFYIRRFFRILPPLIAMMLFMLLLSAFNVIQIPMRQWFAGLFFAANYLRFSDNTYYLGHLWSLSVEEHFYLIFPGVLAIIGVGRGLLLSSAAAIGIIVWRFAAFKIESSGAQFDGGYFWGRTDIIADGLLWGCVVAFLYASPAHDRLRKMLSPVVWSSLCLFLLLTLRLDQPSLNWKLSMILVTLQALVIPFVLLGTVMRSEDVAGRLLEIQAFRWIGRLSYSIYLWQQLFLVLPSYTAPRIQAFQQFPVNFVASLAFAALSYFVLELPMIRVGHKLARPATAGRKELVESGESPSP